MASEPAEPTTRQRLIEKAHDALRTVAYDWSEPTTTDRGRIVTALAEAGLLTDPAQTTELERLKAFERDSLRQIHASWELASRAQAWREDAEDERDERQARIEEHEDLLASIWLYVKWRYVTKQLTTEQKNLWADAVEKVSERHHPGEGAEVDRWWQDDRPTEPKEQP